MDSRSHKQLQDFRDSTEINLRPFGHHAIFVDNALYNSELIENKFFKWAKKTPNLGQNKI